MAETKTKRKTEALTSLWLDVLYFIIGTLVIGVITALVGGRMGNWKDLDLPALAIPSWCFGIFWAVAFTAIGVAMFLAWRNRSRDQKNRIMDLTWFYITLLLHFFWPLFIFRLEMYIGAAIIMGLTAIAAIITMIRFWYNNKISGILYTIFAAWLLYAFYLSLSIAIMNA